MIFSTEVVLGVLAGAVNALAYVLYHLQTRRGDSIPNPASWAIWAFLAVLNALSYTVMGGSVAIAYQFYVGSAASIMTFTYALVAGKFSRPKRRDAWCFAIGILAVFVWWHFRSAAGANILGTIAFIISFYPTLRGVMEDPFKETPRSWVVWTMACSVTLVNAIQKGNPAMLISPFVLFVAHGSIAILSADWRKKRFRPA